MLEVGTKTGLGISKVITVVHHRCTPPYPLVANVPLFPILVFFLFPFFPFFFLLSFLFLLLLFLFFFFPLSEEDDEEEEELSEEDEEEAEVEEEDEEDFSMLFSCKEGAVVTWSSLFASAKAETSKTISTLLVLPIGV